MSLIKSISGIRGTIGGKAGNNLTPLDIVKFSAAYGSWLKEKYNGKKVVLGRDGRISGDMVSQLSINTLVAMGIDVIDAGLSTTPTIEMAVVWEKADGGIIFTASHNPKEWNALKLLNNKGEFISSADGVYILELATNENFIFETVDKLAKCKQTTDYIKRHIEEVVLHKLVNKDRIKTRNFKIVVDTINSTGALCVPQLLEALGVKEVIVINEKITGDFAHNPEPLAEHLTALCQSVLDNKADLGIAVDPDVDRLCFVNEDGSLFGEEYTLVAVADYILGKQKGNTVSNLSSTKSLKEITQQNGCTYYASAVGEVNVVEKMKEVNAVIGGEGNGGIIVPDFHYGRDALIGIGLFLSALAEFDGPVSQFRKKYPDYPMIKSKITLTGKEDIKKLLTKVQNHFTHQPVNTIDGLKIEFDNGWIHLRSSNTEPIIRIYAEGNVTTEMEEIAALIL